MESIIDNQTPKRPLTDEEVTEVRKDLTRIQKKIDKQLSEMEKEYDQERIAEYVEQIDKQESEDPRKFFKRANASKKCHEKNN